MATATAVGKSPQVQGDGHKHKKNALSDGQGTLAWILLAPTLAVILIVAGIPVVMSIRESFFRVNDKPDPNTGLIAQGEQFVGLQNFTAIFAGDNPVTGNWGTMDRFNNAFVNTTFITIVCVILETILGVAMALIMSKAFKGRGVVRAGILVPWAIPTIVSALMWKLIFDEAGVANRILGQQILWLADAGASFWAIVIADVWKTAPFIGLLTLAGLQTIPAEVYEAAKVDGATAWQQFVRHHPADGQADPGGGGALPHARHAADVRPAVRHDRPRQVPGGDAVDLRLPGGRRRPATDQRRRTRSSCSSTCCWWRSSSSRSLVPT